MQVLDLGFNLDTFQLMNIKKYVATALMIVTLGAMSLVHAATEAQAKVITDEFDQAHRAWLAEMKLAKSAGSGNQVMQKRPDASGYAQRLKVLISRDLAKEWTLSYSAWLLENDPGLKPEHQRALVGAVEKYHTKSPRLGRFCMGLIYLQQGLELPRPGQPPIRTRGMNLLRTIKQVNPDPKVQGQASLALSMMLSSLGDDDRVMQERIKNLREAIIKSSEVQVGELTVAKIAEDELYKINHLTKGRLAPNIKGADSGGRVMQLSQYRGKVVMLVFWSSWDNQAARMLGILRTTVSANAAKPLVVLGVNRDSLTNLRALEGDGLVTWKNFADPNQEIAKAYRVASWPYCMVLDQEGVIHYRGMIGSFADAVVNDLLEQK